eukprot:1270727-Pyramimonas_sp.AAC.1
MPIRPPRPEAQRQRDVFPVPHLAGGDVRSEYCPGSGFPGGDRSRAPCRRARRRALKRQAVA